MLGTFEHELAEITKEYSAKQTTKDSLIEKLSEPEAELVIFGAGATGLEFAGKLGSLKGKLKAFCDNFKTGIVERFFVPIISPEQLLRDHNNAIIVVAANDYGYSNEIYNQLIRLGVAEERIFRRYCDYNLLKLQELTKYEVGKINSILAANSKVNLHLGCGTVYKEGWINIDNNTYSNIKKLDINWDLRYPLPFPDNSVDFIFHEHFLEHLTVEEGLKSLTDFRRVLKTGGVMRIAMPNLEVTVARYNAPNLPEKSWLKKFGLEFVRTKAEFINIAFRSWGHKWLYDWEELERRLREAGFNDIKKCELRKSEYIELQNLETRDESVLIVEVSK